MEPSPDLKERVLATARGTPSPTRATRKTQTAIVVVASTFAASGLFAALGGSDLGARPAPFVMGTIAGWSAIALAATWFGFRPGRSTLGRGRSSLFAVLVALPVLLFLWMLSWNAIFPETLAVTPGRPGFRCLGMTLAIAALPLVALAVVRRDRDPLSPALAGSVRGAALGALAGIVVDLWCPIADPGHVAMGHVGPLLVLAVVGGLLGARFAAVRNRRPAGNT